MKILALSDIHGDLGFMQEMALKGSQEKVDLYRRQEISEYNPCLRIYKGTNNKFEYLVPLV